LQSNQNYISLVYQQLNSAKNRPSGSILTSHVIAGKVTATDVKARNGVIHVIDTVLIP